MILPNILLATPTDGHPETSSVTYAYHKSMLELTRMGMVTIPASLFFSDDLARARSRGVWFALQQTGWEYVLWIDDDIKFNPAIVPLMIQAAVQNGYDILAAPYPRKRIKTTYPYIPLLDTMQTGTLNAKNGCAEVEAVAAGFMLTSRKCLESMVTYYADYEWFTDNHDPDMPHETVAIFRQVMTPTRYVDGKRARDLFSEDYSFCWRWRRMGGQIHMYLGPGSPLGHVGGHVFQGAEDEGLPFQ